MPRERRLKKTIEGSMITFEIVGLENQPIVVDTAKFNDEVKLHAQAHGASQRLGDAAAGSTSPEAAHEAISTVVETLMAGEWTTKREGAGPRPSLVLMAVEQALIADGQEVDDARRKTIAEKVKTAEDRKRVLANPKFRAEYDAIRAKALMEKAKTSKAEAKSADADLGDF